MTAWRFDPSRYEGRTEGPWVWRMDWPTPTLATSDRGALIVMDFVRHGMQGAAPRLRDERCLMVPFSSDHPDAKLIQDAPHLLAEVVRLREENAVLKRSVCLNLGVWPVRQRMIAHRHIEKGERVWSSEDDFTRTCDNEGVLPLIAEEDAAPDEVFLCRRAAFSQDGSDGEPSQ